MKHDWKDTAPKIKYDKSEQTKSQFQVDVSGQSIIDEIYTAHTDIAIEINNDIDQYLVREIQHIYDGEYDIYSHENWKINAKKIVDALNKQVPRKVIDTRDYTYCPICGSAGLYEEDVIPMTYCWKCGQKLDWNE